MSLVSNSRMVSVIVEDAKDVTVGPGCLGVSVGSAEMFFKIAIASRPNGWMQSISLPHVVTSGKASCGLHKTPKSDFSNGQSNRFQCHRRAHAAAHAEGGKCPPGFALGELMGQVCDDSRPAGADGVSQGDCSAVDVYPGRVELEFLDTG